VRDGLRLSGPIVGDPAPQKFLLLIWDRQRRFIGNGKPKALGNLKTLFIRDLQEIRKL